MVINPPPVQSTQVLIMCCEVVSCVHPRRWPCTVHIPAETHAHQPYPASGPPSIRLESPGDLLEALFKRRGAFLWAKVVHFCARFSNCVWHPQIIRTWIWLLVIDGVSHEVWSWGFREWALGRIVKLALDWNIWSLLNWLNPITM